MIYKQSYKKTFTVCTSFLAVIIIHFMTVTENNLSRGVPWMGPRS